MSSPPLDEADEDDDEPVDERHIEEVATSVVTAIASSPRAPGADDISVCSFPIKLFGCGWGVCVCVCV